MNITQESPVVSNEIQEKCVQQVLDVVLDAPQSAMKLIHLFSSGYYARVLHIPRDTLIVAKKHKTQHYAVLVSGTMRILEGGVITEKSGVAPHTSKVGTQRIGYAVTDSVYMTVHKTNKTTLAEIEAEVISTQEG